MEPLTGPEVLAGSTRLKAGTAQKVALNVISTGAMVTAGGTYGAWMVDVVASNEKLRRRARRILREATGVDDDTAVAALEDAGWNPKTALVALLAGCRPTSPGSGSSATDGGCGAPWRPTVDRRLAGVRHVRRRTRCRRRRPPPRRRRRHRCAHSEHLDGGSAGDLSSWSLPGRPCTTRWWATDASARSSSGSRPVWPR